MVALQWIAVLLGLLLVGYLTVALLLPEKLS